MLTLYLSYLTYVYPYTKKYPTAHPLCSKLRLTPPPYPPYYLLMTQTQADLIAESRKWLDLLCRSPRGRHAVARAAAIAQAQADLQALLDADGTVVDAAGEVVPADTVGD